VKIEVWLLQTIYPEPAHYMEVFLHISNTNMWITDTGFSQEHLESMEFDKIPHDYSGEYEHLFTKLGEL